MHAQEGVPQFDRSPIAPIKVAVVHCLARRQICALAMRWWTSSPKACGAISRFGQAQNSPPLRRRWRQGCVRPLGRGRIPAFREVSEVGRRVGSRVLPAAARGRSAVGRGKIAGVVGAMPEADQNKISQHVWS